MCFRGESNACPSPYYVSQKKSRMDKNVYFWSKDIIFLPVLRERDRCAQPALYIAISSTHDAELAAEDVNVYVFRPKLQQCTSQWTPR